MQSCLVLIALGLLAHTSRTVWVSNRPVARNEKFGRNGRKAAIYGRILNAVCSHLSFFFLIHTRLTPFLAVLTQNQWNKKKMIFLDGKCFLSPLNFCTGGTLYRSTSAQHTRNSIATKNSLCICEHGFPGEGQEESRPGRRTVTFSCTFAQFFFLILFCKLFFARTEAGGSVLNETKEYL